MPYFGNYYHWALALNKDGTDNWHIFQVVQETEGGPFSTSYLLTNPTRSARCLTPLTYLGKMHGDWWNTFNETIRLIQVPGEADSWNCQDYVIDVWDLCYIMG